MPKEALYTLEEALRLNRQAIQEDYRRYVNPGLAGTLALLDFDKHFVRAEGMYVWDADGNRYLDFLGGYGALNLGHNPPEVLAALDRARGLPNLLQASLGTLAAALAHNLAAITPGELAHSFFCNSGAEAVEGALKLARAATGRQVIVYCENSFHGKSMGALSVTGREKYRQPFRPLVPDCLAVPFGDAAALEGVLRENRAAAFIVEPIQGEGGIIVPPEGYLREIREITRRYGTLLVLDEIQTGFGRTGYLFACQREEVEPDVLCLAKSLGGGVMPIGAFITSDAIWNRAYGGMEKCLLHTSTFGGNALACAAAIAAVNSILAQDLAGRARENGAYFLGRLRELQWRFPLIREVRGQGLLVGIEFESPQGLLNRLTGGKLGELSREYLASLIAGQLQNEYRIITAYTLNNPNVIRLEPPLIAEREHLDAVVDALAEILAGGGLNIAWKSGRTAVGSLFRR